MNPIPTTRQVEALAQLVIGRPLRQRLDGSHDGRAAAAHSGIIGRLEYEGFIIPRGMRRSLKLTTAGLDALEANKHRLPIVDAERLGFVLEEFVADAIRNRRAEIAAEEAEGRRQLEELRAKVAERAAETERRIPERLRELLAEHNLREPLFDRPDARRLDDVLVAFWRAVVNADAAL